MRIETQIPPPHSRRSAAIALRFFNALREETKGARPYFMRIIQVKLAMLKNHAELRGSFSAD